MDTTTAPRTPSGIRRVTCYIASPVETCDRCGQGIKNVCAVFYKDDSRRVFGTECINKVLAGDTSLRSLWRKNVKVLAYRRACLAALELGENAPVGQEYYGSGMFFIATADGQSVCGDRGQSFWHPNMDLEKNLSGQHYRQDGKHWLGGTKYNTPENFRATAFAGIEQGKKWFSSEITRLETFLARVLANAHAKGFEL